MPEITDFELSINKEFVLHTLDCRTDSDSYEEVSQTFDQLKDKALSLVKPKAVYEIYKTKHGYLSDELKNAEYTVYAMFTLGGDISAEVTKCFNEGLYLEGMILDHMADDILGGSLGKAISTYIMKECEQQGLGITKMLTPAEQIPIQTQTIIAEELDAYNRLGIGISSGFMIDPVKSSSFILGADKNLPFREVEHDCEKCSIITCRWKNFGYLKEKTSDVKPVTITVHSGNKSSTINTETGKDLLTILRENKIYIPAVCAGNGTCGKCKIKTDRAFAVSQSDVRLLNDTEINNGIRLACTAYPVSDTAVTVIQNDDKFDIVTNYISNEPDVKKKLNHRYNVIEVSIDQKTKDLMYDITKAAPHVKNYAYIKVLPKLAQFINSGNSNFKSNKLYALLRDSEVCDISSANDIQAYGIAIDIGTTTIVAALINLLTCEQVTAYSCINSQRAYGADVISRIQSANNGALIKMRDCITADITESVKKLLELANIDKQFVYEAAIAGNTTMLHILMGLPVESIGLFPFKSTFTNLLTFRYSEIFSDDYLDCDVAVLPSISAYVGADITSGIIVSGMSDTIAQDNNQKAKILIDLGTNGEMAIAYRDKMYCTSTAAGPALEGGNISCGTGGIPGAISKIKVNKYTKSFETETIQNKYPIGICGSGVIDIAAELVKNKMLNETGLIDDDILTDNQGKYYINGDIYFTQKDIREIQLAKSAVRAGLECILAQAAKDADNIAIQYKTPYELVDSVYIAGGFGFHINIENTAIIGLIPKELLSKVRLIGNSALAGAKLYVSDSKARSKFAEVANNAIEINLSTDTKFNDLFIEYISFDVEDSD